MFSDYLLWDSHVFLLIGRWFTEGLLPYRDVWEVKPPGIFFYIAFVFAFLPKALWSLRVSDFFFHLLGAAAFYRLCRCAANRGISAAATCLWLYFAHHPRFSATGLYTEEYSAILAVVAVCAAATFAAGGRLPHAFLAGTAVSVGALFKHPGAAAFAPSLILILSRPNMRSLAAFVAGGIFPLLFVLGFFWMRGGLDAFLECNLWYPLTYTQGKHGGAPLFFPRLREAIGYHAQLFREFPVLPAALAVGLVACALRPNRFRVAVLSWLACDFLFIALQGHYFQHHYIQIFPAIIVSGAVGAAWIAQPGRGERRPLVLARLAAVFAALFLVQPALRAVWEERRPVLLRQWDVLRSGPGNWRVDPGNPADEDEIALYIRSRTSPRDRIHVHAYNPTALAAYWSADRHPAARFFHSLPYGDAYLLEQLEELKRRHPAIVVLVGEPLLRTLRDWLAAEYVMESVKWRNYRAEIWVRK